MVGRSRCLRLSTSATFHYPGLLGRNRDFPPGKAHRVSQRIGADSSGQAPPTTPARTGAQDRRRGRRESDHVSSTLTTSLSLRVAGGEERQAGARAIAFRRDQGFVGIALTRADLAADGSARKPRRRGVGADEVRLVRLDIDRNCDGRGFPYGVPLPSVAGGWARSGAALLRASPNGIAVSHGSATHAAPRGAGVPARQAGLEF